MTAPRLISVLILAAVALLRADVLIDDFSDADYKTNLLMGYWFNFDDRANNGGNSVAEPFAVVDDNGERVGHLSYTLGADYASRFAGIAANLGQQTPAGKASVDMSATTALTLRIKGSGTAINVVFQSSKVTNSNFRCYKIAASPAAWTELTINIPGDLVESFTSSSKPCLPWDSIKTSITAIQFKAASKVDGESGELFIDSIVAVGNLSQNRAPIVEPSTFGTLFTCNFDNEPEGLYTGAQLAAAWNNPLFDNGVAEGRCAITAANAYAGKSLAVTYPKDTWGTANSGAQWNLYFDSGAAYDSLYCEYKVMFPLGFEFAKGGKLPGLAGGEAPSGGMIPDSTDGFSARMMWRGNSSGADGAEGYVQQYLYYMDMKTPYGTDLWWETNGIGVEYDTMTQWLPDEKVHFEPGIWHTVKTMVRVNTPGSRNGRIVSWLDGKKVLEIDTLRYRGTGPETFRVDQFYFSTFFGGKDSTWAPVSSDQHAYFDDFIVSTANPSPDSAWTTAIAPHASSVQTAALSYNRGSIRTVLPAAGTLRILSLNGRCLQSLPVAAQVCATPLRGLAAGVYLARVQSQSLVSTARIVVE